MGSWFVVHSCFQQNPTDGMLLMACVVHFTIFYHLIYAHGHTGISWIQGHTKVKCMNLHEYFVGGAFCPFLFWGWMWNCEILKLRCVFPVRNSHKSFSVEDVESYTIWRSWLESTTGVKIPLPWWQKAWGEVSLSSDRRGGPDFGCLRWGTQGLESSPFFWRSTCGSEGDSVEKVSPGSEEALQTSCPLEEARSVAGCLYERAWRSILPRREWGLGGVASLAPGRSGLQWDPGFQSEHLGRLWGGASSLFLSYLWNISMEYPQWYLGWIIRTCHVTMSLECFSPGEGLRNLTRHFSSFPLSFPSMYGKQT